MNPYVHSSTIHNSQDKEATSVSTDRLTDEDAVHTHNGHHSATRKNEIMPLVAKQVDLQIIILSEFGKGKTNTIDITCMWDLKYDANEPIYKKLDSQRQRTALWLPWGRVGGRMEWEAGVRRCKLLHMEQINKVLLYSTQTYIQYPMIN